MCGGATAAAHEGSSSASAFPLLPMVALCLALLTHGFALTSLFSYVGFMVSHLTGGTTNRDQAGEKTASYMRASVNPKSTLLAPDFTKGAR
jgi:hypothetical protein